MLGLAAFGIVLVGLMLTVRVQMRPLRRYRDLLDLLALVPEWRFYAQASIRQASVLATDIHLVVRDGLATGEIGDWRPIMWPAGRRVHHGIWNPDTRIFGDVLAIAGQAARTWQDSPNEDVQQSIPYLLLLRRCLQAPTDRPDTVTRQFAIVRTMGRGERELFVDFVSAWHRW